MKATVVSQTTTESVCRAIARPRGSAEAGVVRTRTIVTVEQQYNNSAPQ